MRRVVGWLLGLGLAAGVAGAVVLWAGLAWLDSSAGREWVRGIAGRELGALLGTEVALRSVDTDGLTIVAEDLEVTIQGRPFAVARRVVARPALSSLWPPALALALEVADFEVRIGRGPDGLFDVERLLAEGDETPPPIELRVLRFALAGGRVRIADLAPEPIGFERLRAVGELYLGSDRPADLRVDRASALSGGLEVTLAGSLGLGEIGTVAVTIEAQGTLGEELGALAALRPDLDVAVRGSATGVLSGPTATLQLEAAGATLTGDLTYIASEAGSLRAKLRLAGLDPARLLPEAPSGVLRGEARVALEPAQGLEGLHAELRLRDSVLAELELEEATLAGDARAGVLAVQAEAWAPARAYGITATGSVDLEAPHEAEFRADISLDDSSRLPAPLAPWLAESRLRGRVAGRARQLAEVSREVEVEVELEPGRVRGLALERALARAELRGERLRVESLELVGGGTRLRAAGEAELAEGGAVEARIAGPIDLQLLPDTSGVLETDVELRGRLGDLAAVARLRSVEALTRPELSTRLDLDAELRGLGSGAASATLAASGRAHLRGTLAEALGEEAREVELTATFRESSGAASEAVLPGRLEAALGVTELDGRAHRLAAAALLGAEPFGIELEAFEVSPAAGAPWKLARPARLALGAGLLEVAGLRVTSRDGDVQADGALRKGTGRNDLRAAVRDVDLALLCALAALAESCAGRVSLQLEARGSGAEPRIEGRLDVVQLRVDGRDYGDLRARIAADRRLRVEASLGEERSPELRAEASFGVVPGGLLPAIDRGAPMELRVEAAALSLGGLRGLLGAAIRDVDGTLHVDLRAGGTPDRPRIEGGIRATDLLLALTDTGVTYSGGSAVIRIDSDAVRLTELSFSKGAVRAGGAIGLDGFAPTSFDLWLDLSRAVLLARPMADARASGRVTLTGSAAAPRLEGELVVGPATIRPTFAAGGAGPAPDPTITVIRGPEEAAGRADDPIGRLLAGQPIDSDEASEDAPVGASGTEDPLAVRIRLRVGDRVLIQRTDALLRLTGDLMVAKEPGEDLRVVGAIESENGWYLFQGRRVEIERAAVRFGGQWPIDPDLEVRAAARTGGYDVHITVTGTLAEPTLDLSSSPPLDQSDILAVLLFGKPLSQLSGGQGEIVQQQAIGVLAAYVAPELQRSLMDSFGLAAVTFTMPTGDRAGTFGIGRYFGDDIFISLAQDFGGPKGGTQRQLQGLIGTSVMIQYSLTPSLTLQSASSTEGESSVDLIWHRRY